MKEEMTVSQQQDLYCPTMEHDNCGIGAVVNLRGSAPTKPWMTRLRLWSVWSIGLAKMHWAKPVTV